MDYFVHMNDGRVWGPYPNLHMATRDTAGLPAGTYEVRSRGGAVSDRDERDARVAMRSVGLDRTYE